jgi:hypothetical protein
MLRRVALVRTDVSEELSASFIRLIRICDEGTNCFFILEDGILNSHNRENLKCYIALTGWAL